MAVPIAKMKVGSKASQEEHQRTFHWPEQMMKAEQPHSAPGLGQSGERGSQGGAEVGRKNIPNPKSYEENSARLFGYSLLIFLWV